MTLNNNLAAHRANDGVANTYNPQVNYNLTGKELPAKKSLETRLMILQALLTFTSELKAEIRAGRHS